MWKRAARSSKRCGALTTLGIAASAVATLLIATIVKIPNRQDIQRRKEDQTENLSKVKPSAIFQARTSSIFQPTENFQSCVERAQIASNYSREWSRSSAVAKCLRRRFQSATDRRSRSAMQPRQCVSFLDPRAYIHPASDVRA